MKKQPTLWPAIAGIGFWVVLGWMTVSQSAEQAAIAEEAKPKWELVKSIPLTARCSEEHVSVQSVYIGQVEWSVEVKTGRHRTFAVLLQDSDELRRWSERAIDQMNKGSGSAEPYLPPSMVVLFSDDHSLPRKGYSSSLRHDRPSNNVVCSTVQATE